MQIRSGGGGGGTCIWPLKGGARLKEVAATAGGTVLNNCLNENKLTSGGCLPLSGAIYMYMTTIFKHPLL